MRSSRENKLNDQILVSDRTRRRLIAELNQLKNEELPRKRSEMRVALELGGGMHDNAPYEHSAYDEQVILRRIAVLEAILEKAEVIDNSIDGSAAGIGTRVTAKNLEDNSVTTYLIVGAYDDIGDEGRVSYLSPIGKGLTGCSVGDDVSIDLPTKQVRLRVTGVERASANDSV